MPPCWTTLASSQVVAAATHIGTAVVPYPVFRRQNKILALAPDDAVSGGAIAAPTMPETAGEALRDV
jgi:hypothetical protein